MSWYKASASTLSANLPGTANTKSFHMGSTSNKRKNQPFLSLVCMSATFAPSASASDKKPTVYLDPAINKQFQIYSPALSHRETTHAHGLPGLRVPDICIARKRRKHCRKIALLAPVLPVTHWSSMYSIAGEILKIKSTLGFGNWGSWANGYLGMRVWGCGQPRDSIPMGNQVILSSETRRNMGWRGRKWKPWPCNRSAPRWLTGRTIRWQVNCLHNYKHKIIHLIWLTWVVCR